MDRDPKLPIPKPNGVQSFAFFRVAPGSAHGPLASLRAAPARARATAAAMGDNKTTYRRPSVSIGMGFDGADYSWMTNEKENATGFFITFNVPFKRADVFKELLSDECMLGSEPDGGVKYTIIKPGREEGKANSSQRGQ